MSDEEINIAIAETCGWRRHPKDPWIVIDPKCQNSAQPLSTIPDYCNDLNAMRIAEEMLASKEQCAIFACELAVLVKGFAHDPFLGCSSHIWHATARQRAEAFLRTIGKWKEAAK